MKITKKLIGFMHRVFNKSPEQFLALRIRCDGIGLTWAISDAVLVTSPIGGTALPLSVDLTKYTVAGLASYIGMQQGYSIAYVNGTAMVNLSAAVLLDGSGDVTQLNGDQLYGYTSALWAYMEANAAELKTAELQIGQMVKQMSTITAEDMWLDELGGYYAVPRAQGELDAQYGPRIIATVLRPLANNVAIEAALAVINGGLPTTCTDYDQIVNGSYGLFDIDIEVSLDLLAIKTYTALILSIVESVDRMRDAGTFMRRLAIITKVMATYYSGAVVISGETVTMASDYTLFGDGSEIADGTQYATGQRFHWTFRANGSFNFDGSFDADGMI